MLTHDDQVYLLSYYLRTNHKDMVAALHDHDTDEIYELTLSISMEEFNLEPCEENLKLLHDTAELLMSL